MDYSDDYHRSVGEGAERSARVIARIVHALMRPESVVDVGCGIGEWLLAFAELGVGDYLGVDAPDLSEGLLSIDPERFLARDLGEPLALRRTFDLAVSLEVAEHLPPERGEGFVEDLCRLAPAVLFSAAVPGQGDPESTGHVNERWQSYWVSLFHERGYGRVECVRPVVWENPRVEIWYRQNTVLYVSAERLSSDAVLERAQRENAAFPASVVHPDPTSEHLASRAAQRENRRLKRRIRRLKERLGERPDSDPTQMASAKSGMQQSGQGMRWSSPGRKPRRGVVKGTRMVRQGASLSKELLSKRRPGKKRAEIVRLLVENDGSATREGLLECFGGPKTKQWDFKKQTLGDLLGRRRQYKEQPLALGPPVVELTDEGIRLVENWEEALEEQRIIGEDTVESYLFSLNRAR